MSKNFRTSEIIPKNSDLLNNALKIIIIQITFEFLIKNVETKNGFINIIDINKNRQILQKSIQIGMSQSINIH